METAQEMTSKPRHGRDLRAVVLVGGRDFGRCPLAARRPTALWPVTDKPVLAHLLEHLARAGLARVAVCCAKDDAAAVGAVCREAPLETTLVVEELTAGTAGCLRDAVASDPGDLIIVLSGSILAPPALDELVAAHQAGGAELTLVFNPDPDHETALGGPAEIYLCRPEILRHIPPGGYSDIKEGLIPAILRAGGTVRPIVLGRDVGNFHQREGYLQALEVLARADTPPAPGAVASQTPRREGSDVSVHPTARLCGPVLLGAHVSLAEGAVVIGPAVLGSNVSVGAQSVVVRSALWADAHVGARCEVRESIVDGGVVVPEGAAVVERTVVAARSACPSGRARLSSRSRELIPLEEKVESSLERWAARLPAWASCSGRQLAYALAGVVVLAALLWSYWPTLRDLMTVWRVSEEYNSGLLVPFLAVYIVWLRRVEWRSLSVRPALFPGLVAFGFAQGVRSLGLDFYSAAERLSLILSLAAMVLLVLGWKYLTKLATVLLFLCLMLPWPHRIQGAISLPLQRWSTTSAVYCLEMAGYEVQQDGNQMTVNGVPLFVAEACNGLRMITAFFVISGLVVLLVQRAWWEKGIILGSSLPIAYLCNTLRLAVTAIFFTIIKTKVWQNRVHDLDGYAMMPVALALVVGELWLLTRLTTPVAPVAPAVIARRHTPQLPDPQ